MGGPVGPFDIVLIILRSAGTSHQTSTLEAFRVSISDSDARHRIISPADWELNLLQDHFHFGADSDFQLTEHDANFLSSFPETLPMDEHTNFITHTLLISPVVSEENSQLVMDAFKQATGRWTPATRNFQAEEENNLPRPKVPLSQWSAWDIGIRN